MDIETCTKAIERSFAQLLVESIRPLLPGGWDYFVVEVNDELIFRFPQRHDAELGLHKEIALLPGLSRMLKVPIPNHEFVAQTADDGTTFVGYRKIEGVPLSADFINSKDSLRLAQSISSFLSELHAIPSEQTLDWDGRARSHELDYRGVMTVRAIIGMSKSC